MSANTNYRLPAIADLDVLANQAAIPSERSSQTFVFQVLGQRARAWNVDRVRQHPDQGRFGRVTISPAQWFVDGGIAEKKDLINVEYASLISPASLMSEPFPLVATLDDGFHVVIDGNHRLYRAYTLGLDEAPVLLVPGDVLAEAEFPEEFVPLAKSYNAPVSDDTLRAFVEYVRLWPPYAFPGGVRPKYIDETVL